jgi:hypothetical protein
MGNMKTLDTEQEILNMSSDQTASPRILTVGLKSYHPLGGWLPAPIANLYPSAQLDWASGELDYYGVNASASAADGDTSWVIYKFTYSGGNMTKIQSKVGTWTARAVGW